MDARVVWSERHKRNVIMNQCSRAAKKWMEGTFCYNSKYNSHLLKAHIHTHRHTLIKIGNSAWDFVYNSTTYNSEIVKSKLWNRSWIVSYLMFSIGKWFNFRQWKRNLVSLFEIAAHTIMCYENCCSQFGRCAPLLRSVICHLKEVNGQNKRLWIGVNLRTM